MFENVRYCNLLLLLVVMSSCGNNENDQQGDNNLQSSSSKKTHSTVKDTVLTYKVIKKDDLQCKEWKEPSKNEIISILNLLKEVPGTEWHDCYGDWTCGIEGELIYKNEKNYYRLDAGGWIILNNDVDQRYYACRNSQDCWQFFPSESFCDEEGVIKD